MKITTTFNETYNENRIDYIKKFTPKFNALGSTLDDVSCIIDLYQLYNTFIKNTDYSNPFIFITFETNSNKFNCINFSKDAFISLLSILETEVIKDIKIVF